MQTFLPYPDFEQSLRCLDKRRLLKQVVEAGQIYNTLINNSKAWSNHPAVLMWKGYENALAQYHNVAYSVGISLGINWKVVKPIIIEGEVIIPFWFGNEVFHNSHKSNLFRKDPIYYQAFNDIGPSLPYFWPVRK